MQSSHGDNVLENLNKEKDRKVNTLKTTFYQESVFGVYQPPPKKTELPRLLGKRNGINRRSYCILVNHFFVTIKNAHVK